MPAETEPQSSIQEDEPIKKLADIINATFRDLLAAIKKLVFKKEKESRLSEGEEALLQHCQLERKKRRVYVFSRDQNLKNQKKQIEEDLKTAASRLESTSESEKPALLGQLKDILLQKKEQARQTAEKKDSQLSKKHQGAVEDEFDELIDAYKAKAEQAAARLSAEDSAPGRPEDGQDFQSALGHRLSELRHRLMQNPDDREAAVELNRLAASQQMSIYDLFTPAEIEEIKTNDKARERAFQRLINNFGNNKNRSFMDADMKAHTGWSQFTLALLEIDGGRDILEEFQYRLGFEEQMHNLDMFLRGQSKIAEIPQILAHFESRMFDAVLRQPGVAAAFRAYEQAFHRLMMIEGSLPASKIGWDPEEKKVWVNNWVNEQVKKTLTAYCQEKGLDFETEFKPYIDTMIRTGWKVFIFTTRGDEIQASSEKPRKGLIAPWHEDFWRRLDPLSLPLKYWGDKLGTKAFLEQGSATATALWYFFTGEEKQFRSSEEFEAAVDKAKKEGKIHLNLFNIGGILSKSDWRATIAMDHIPAVLRPFLGMEIHWKYLNHQYKNVGKARREAFAFGTIRNPLGLFRLADEQDQNAILAACGVGSDSKDKKTFLDSVYNDMALALENLVYRQQEEIKQILKLSTKEEREAAAEAFYEREKNMSLDFSFSEKAENLERFTKAIQNRFQEKDPAKEKNPAMDRLVSKRIPFSIGTEDAALELGRFLEVGDIGLQRRFRDIGEAAHATEALWVYIKDLPVILQKDEDICKGLKAIFDGLDGYGASNINQIMEAIIDRTFDMIAEDKLQDWLPWPLGDWRAKYGFTSKAEKLYGQYSTSKGGDEMRLLLEKIIGTGIFATSEKAIEVRKRLYKKHKMRVFDILKWRAWQYSPLILAGLTMSAVMILYKQLEKDIEEVAKNA